MLAGVFGFVICMFKRYFGKYACSCNDIDCYLYSDYADAGANIG
jgi:hypothetical protein